MSNYSIKLDLTKIGGAFVANIQGRTARKKCLCIPIEDAHLFVGEKGLYADFTAIEMREPHNGTTHIIKQNLPKEVFQSMTDEERRALPIIGNMSVLQRRQPSVEDIAADNAAVSPDSYDDLPF